MGHRLIMDSVLSSNKAFAGLNALFGPNPFTIRALILNLIQILVGIIYDVRSIFFSPFFL